MQQFRNIAAEGEDGPEASVVIGGVDLRELKAAHAQHPLLSRWHNTTLVLVSDLMDEKAGLQTAVRELEAAGVAQAKRIKELEEKYELDAEDKPEGEAEEETPSPTNSP